MLVGNILAVSWPEVGKTALLYGAVGVFHYVFRHKFLAISMDPKRGRGRRDLDRVLGFPVLRVVRLRRHLLGRDCRRAAGVLLPDRPVGRRDVVLRSHRQAAGDRLVDGHVVSALGVYLSLAARSADRRDDRVHVRAGAGDHGGRAAAPSTASCGSLKMRCRQCGTEIADKALICYRCGTATTEAKFKAPAAPVAGGRAVRWARRCARAVGPAGDPAAARAVRLTQ